MIGEAGYTLNVTGHNSDTTRHTETETQTHSADTAAAMATPTARRLCPRARGGNAATRKKLGKVPAQTRAAGRALTRSAARDAGPVPRAGGGTSERDSRGRRPETRRRTERRQSRDGRIATASPVPQPQPERNTAAVDEGGGNENVIGEHNEGNAQGTAAQDTDTGRGQPQTINGRQSEETSSHRLCGPRGRRALTRASDER